MKNLILIFSVLLSISLSAVEYGVLSSSGTDYPQHLVLNEGDICEILSATRNDSNYNSIQFFRADSINIAEGINPDQIDGYMDKGIILSGALDYCKYIAGPIAFKIYRNTSSGNYNGSHFLLFYKLTRASELEYKNINIVSLPSSAVGQGTHEIVVEASDDLQSWTPVHSSSIGGDKAFFRTRVVERQNNFMKNLVLIFSVLLSTSLSAFDISLDGVEFGKLQMSSTQNTWTDQTNFLSEALILNEGDVLQVLRFSSDGKYILGDLYKEMAL